MDASLFAFQLHLLWAESDAWLCHRNFFVVFRKFLAETISKTQTHEKWVVHAKVGGFCDTDTVQSENEGVPARRTKKIFGFMNRTSADTQFKVQTEGKIKHEAVHCPIGRLWREPPFQCANSEQHDADFDDFFNSVSGIFGVANPVAPFLSKNIFRKTCIAPKYFQKNNLFKLFRNQNSHRSRFVERNVGFCSKAARLKEKSLKFHRVTLFCDKETETRHKLEFCSNFGFPTKIMLQEGMLQFGLTILQGALQSYNCKAASKAYNSSKTT